MSATLGTQVALPAPGHIVRVRSRQYLVEEVTGPPAAGDQSLVRLSCLEDDAQGEPLEVLWEREIDAQVLGEASWKDLAKKGFDPIRLFAAYLNTLRWRCVTSTDPRLFQAPYRAGIDVMAYQLEPLRKALRLPRVNLFIADDVGLGKTIEAGLIVRELLMRQKVRSIVVACPPSVLLQWQEEMENRFGLTFVVFDRNYIAQKRRELGYAVNPWRTHSRFIISHALLRNEDYAADLRDWLGDFAAGSLLILDEAHNAAPASGAKYAIDSQFTRVVRDVAQRFEHRLFLSATPHNGHSNSFSSLLEILDPQRFCRGVPVKSAAQLEPVMVRRLKSDLRKISGSGFPERKIVQVDIKGLPEDTPELKLARLLNDYRNAREARFRDATRTAQVSAALVTTSLQKRLFSSIEGFACTLRVHVKSLEKQSAKVEATPAQLSLLQESPGADDERAEVSEDQVREEEEVAMESASRVGPAQTSPKERKLLNEMTEIAENARNLPDARVKDLVEWIRTNLCPSRRWNNRRTIIFTEYADTKRYLEQRLREALADTDQAAQRISTFHGGMGEESREEVKRAFNANPARHPLRILIATDAAREGVNLQNHCADLFHFDLPWNPSRLEQRNGRIDRKLQREAEVRCHYFVYRQRPEDRVILALVKKTENIQKELGALSPVLHRRIAHLLAKGIERERADGLAAAIESEELPEKSTVTDELETAREKELAKQIDDLRKLLDQSKKHIGLEEAAFRDALSCGTELIGAGPLKKIETAEKVQRWELTDLNRLLADPAWADTLDTLRPPRLRDQMPWEWRKNTTIRPVVFSDPGSITEDVVHLHLEHRVVQRLLGRFAAQGFVHDDLSRACVGQTKDALPRVLLLGRLSLYGDRASRLHDEILVVAARWVEPKARTGRLKPFAEDAEGRSFELLQESLTGPKPAAVPDPIRKRLAEGVERDVEDLLSHLKKRAEEVASRAKDKLAERGEKEAKDMAGILSEQRKRIEKQYDASHQLEFEFEGMDEKRQLESDRRHWKKRLADIDKELKSEPDRIRGTYQVKAERIEPVGVVYLWPISG